MPAQHFMASAIGAKLDAFRSVYDPRATYYLMRADPTAAAGRGLSPMEVAEGTRPDGEIRRGVYLERRRFDREGSPLPTALIVSVRGPWTMSAVPRRASCSSARPRASCINRPRAATG